MARINNDSLRTLTKEVPDNIPWKRETTPECGNKVERVAKGSKRSRYIPALAWMILYHFSGLRESIATLATGALESISKAALPTGESATLCAIIVEWSDRLGYYSTTGKAPLPTVKQAETIKGALVFPLPNGQCIAMAPNKRGVFQEIRKVGDQVDTVDRLTLPEDMPKGEITRLRYFKGKKNETGPSAMARLLTTLCGGTLEAMPTKAQEWFPTEPEAGDQEGDNTTE